MSTRLVVLTEPAAEYTGEELLARVIDPEIRKFEEWFQVPERGNGPLTKLEKELLRSFLWAELTGKL